ncbi:hypothetical protein [Gordonia westfalica]|uniref:hypothetical protein n=1 Tax=Gordonia westfalica TaxID=158898 RepID=UPI0015957935|nr:hypothetical protein [Gordonia westfalica]
MAGDAECGGVAADQNGDYRDDEQPPPPLLLAPAEVVAGSGWRCWSERRRRRGRRCCEIGETLLPASHLGRIICQRHHHGGQRAHRGQGPITAGRVIQGGLADTEVWMMSGHGLLQRFEAGVRMPFTERVEFGLKRCRGCAVIAIGLR